jgi:hypothetical protein
MYFLRRAQPGYPRIPSPTFLGLSRWIGIYLAELVNKLSRAKTDLLIAGINVILGE